MPFNGFARRTTSKYALYAFFWSCSFIFGFLAGAFVGFRSTSHYTLLLRSAVTSPTSAVALLTQVIFMFSLTAAAYMLRRDYGILVCFIEAFAFGIASTVVYLSFDHSEWLIRTPILFTKTITLICLIWFWFRNILGQSHTSKRDFVLALLVSILAAIFDHNWISPYICYLFDYCRKVCSYVGFGSSL